MKRTPVKDRFKDKVAIVTGGSAGIGKAIVHELAIEGASVCFSGRNMDTGEKTESEFQSENLNVCFLSGDMQDDEFCEQIVSATINRFGGIDYLVNNAFSFNAKSLDANRDDWNLSFQAGPIAYARMIQLCSESIRERGGGSIVNMSSISAFIAQKKRWTYNSAKGAVNQLSKCAALDLAEYGIRVNSVSPALIWTREVEKGLNKAENPEELKQIWNDFHILRRMGDPMECAGPVLFLLSNDASFITGADLPIDGGFLALGPQGIGKYTSMAGSR